ncbi:MAG: tetratricopeptide repeat protein [Salinivirgaceae bacterium]|nr:tetratricopeptide repeat protein [Salinivirgaceae bacterium]
MVLLDYFKKEKFLKSFVLIMALFFYLQINAQPVDLNKTIDSLVICLESANNDTTKIEILNSIGTQYKILKSPKALEYYQLALKNSEKIAYKKGIAISYYQMGLYNFNQSLYNESISYFNKALIFFKKIEDSLSISDCYKNIGYCKALQNDFTSAIVNYKLAIEIYEELNNDIEISGCLNNIGVFYNYMGDHLQSIEYQKKSLAVCEKMGDKTAISSRLLNLGASYDDISNYQEAISCYIKALELKIELQDSSGISSCYNNLGEVYNDQGNYANAILHYEKSLNIDQAKNDSVGIAICLLNIGNVHFKQMNYNKAQEYYKNSFVIAQKINDTRILANVLNSIGELYIEQQDYNKAIASFENAYEQSVACGDVSEIAKSVYFMGEVFLNQKKYNKAIEQYQRAGELHEELGEKSKLAADYIKMGFVYFLSDHFSKALKLTHKGLETAKQVGSKENISLASQYLSQMYASQRDFEKAYEYSTLFKQVHDSIFTIESQKQIHAVENRFELASKQQEIEIQKITLEKQGVEIKQQKIRHIALLGGFGGIVLIVIIVVINFIKIKKARDLILEHKARIEEANEELNQSNEELIVTLESNNKQKELIEKSNKEITDSIQYANYIQKAVLPSKVQFDELVSDHFVFFKPKNIVSGDFYWITKVENQLIIAAADCTGHGVPGALMSMLGVSFLNDIINKEYITNPGVVLRRMRKEVINALHQEGSIGERRDGMDLSLCSINLDSMELQFAGANSPLYIIREKSKEPIECDNSLAFNKHVLYEIKGDKMPIAMYAKMDRFRTVEISIQKDDILYMFSDGFIDQFGGPEVRRYKYKPFKELLLANCDKSLTEQKYILEKTFNNWKKNQEQIDDVMVLGIII